mmetsp:Transcript_42065/g.127589  ORF Transcript_42065/g.127589 Transcript_42065/m.127589 type:complete len:256 (+) Transcript_42065:1763-2530(+)
MQSVEAATVISSASTSLAAGLAIGRLRERLGRELVQVELSRGPHSFLRRLTEVLVFVHVHGVRFGIREGGVRPAIRATAYDSQYLVEEGAEGPRIGHAQDEPSEVGRSPLREGVGQCGPVGVRPGFAPRSVTEGRRPQRGVLRHASAPLCLRRVHETGEALLDLRHDVPNRGDEDARLGSCRPAAGRGRRRGGAHVPLKYGEAACQVQDSEEGPRQRLELGPARRGSRLRARVVGEAAEGKRDSVLPGTTRGRRR